MNDLKKSKLLSKTYFEKSSISYLDIITLLSKQLKIIIIFPLIVCMLTFLKIMFFTKPVYTSTSKIMSSSNSGNISQAVGIAAQFGISLPTAQSEPKWPYPDIIMSRTLAKSMLKREFNIDGSDQKKTLLDILMSPNKKNILPKQRLEAMAVDKFLKMINIYENLKSSILTVTIDANEPILASEINKALIKELDSHQRDYNKARTSDTKIFIQERIIDIEKELITAEEVLKVFMDRNRRIQNSPALQLEQQRLGREVTVLTGVFTTLKQQLETTKIEEVKESDYVIVLDMPGIPLQKSKPNKKLMLLIAGLIGVSLGFFLAVLREFSSNHSTADANRIKKAKVTAFENLNDLFFGKLK